MSDDIIQIEGGPAIPRAELTYRATRSGGPGGQHVNTSSTRVELTWNVTASPALTDEQRTRILEKLATRIDDTGTLRVVAADSRSQHQNRETATARFAELVARALVRPKPRRATRPPKASKEARLEEKKQRGEVKKKRGRVDPGE
jgi:ribosome-associated protein